MQRLPEATRRKISWGNIKINSMVLMTMTIVIQTILMGIIMTNFILEKSKFDFWYMFVKGAHKRLQDTLDEIVQTTIKYNPYIDTEETDGFTYD